MTPQATVRWNLKGAYFETCNCTVACPCIFLSSPNEGDCKLLAAWHIDEGSFGEVKLDGLNAAMVVHAPGHMLKVKWKAALYLDEKADRQQTDALTRIFAGQAGGPPAALAPFVGEVLGVKSVPITSRLDGRRRSLVIPRVAQVDIEGIGGQDGAEVTVSNPPLMAGYSGLPIVVAKSKVLHYTDYGIDWNLSEKSGFYTTFRYSGP